MKRNDKKYVKCEIAAGTYGDAKYIMVRDKGSIVAAGFFPPELIRKNKLLVNVYKIKKGQVLIGIDKDSDGRFLSGSKTWVPKKLIVSR